MATVMYRGPGDSISIDGLEIKKGEKVELDPGQIARIRVDPTAELDVSDETDTPKDRERIRAAQDEMRDRAARDAQPATPERGQPAQKAGE